MDTITPSKIEERAAEIIREVENVVDCKRLVPCSDPTPDWRMKLKDGRVADVEVTRCVDQPERELFAAAHTRDGLPKKWHSKKLSYSWFVMMDDRDPAFNKKRRPLKQAANDAITVLSEVEAAGGSTQQMAQNASVLFEGGLLGSRTSEETMTVRSSVGLQIQDGDRSQRLIVAGAPEWVGRGAGSVEISPMTIDGSSGCRALVSDVQDAIDRKTNSDQMANSPGLKWLAVMVEGLAVFQIKDYYGPGSRYYDHTNAQHPALDGIAFSHFDEVWVCSWKGPAALRLLDGGAEMTVHHL